MDTKKIIDQTDIDTLDAQPYPGVDTLLKALTRTVDRLPNGPALGTRVGDAYEWMTWIEVLETS